MGDSCGGEEEEIGVGEAEGGEGGGSDVGWGCVWERGW